MGKASPLIQSFSSGELSPLLEGRPDFVQYQSGCRVLENAITKIQGPASKRAGTYYIGETKYSNRQCWLVPFKYSNTVTYILEFGHQYLRFYTDYGLILAAGSPAYNAGATYLLAQYVTYSGLTYRSKQSANLGNTPDVSPTWWEQLDIYELPTVYSESDLIGDSGEFNLRISRPAGNIMNITHAGGKYTPQQLTRFSDIRWEIGPLQHTWGPFKEINSTSTTVYASATTGSVTLTASSGIFTSTLVGSLFYIEQRTAVDVKAWEAGKSITAGDLRRSNGINYKALNTATTGTVKPTHIRGAQYDGDTGVQWEYQDPGYGYVTITGYTSSTQVTATVLSQIPDNAVGSGKATTRWALGAWSEVEGYPTVVSTFKERTVYGRGLTVWLSVAGDYLNFNTRDNSGNIVADAAFERVIPSDDASDIEWISPSAGSLLIGTGSGEFSLQPVTTGQVFGPENATVSIISNFGSRGIQPTRIGDTVQFIQSSGETLVDVTYDFINSRFQGSDKTLFSEHITNGGITQIVYQQEPNSILWAVRSDGVLLSFCFVSEQKIEGWSRHIMGGGGFVEAIAVGFNTTIKKEELYLVVKRTINGSTKRYIEYMKPEYRDGDNAGDVFYSDCALTYNGSAVTTISGLSHLEGKSVVVLGDGARVGDSFTVASGAITLPYPVSKAQIGLPYTMKLQPMRLNSGGADGTSQGKTARINKVAVRLYKTVGLKYGQSFNSLTPVPFRSTADLLGQPVPYFTGDVVLDFPNDYSNDPQICFQHDEPLPCTIIALMPQVTVQDR